MYQSTDGDSLPCDATSVDETQADWGRRLVEADALVLEEIHDGLWPLFSGRLAARYKSLNQQDVEDLWQRALFQLWDQRDRFQPERNVAPWLWTISKNLALDVLRSASRRIQVLIDPVDMRDFADLNASDPNGDDHANPVLRTEAGDDATGRLLARLENRCERLTGHVERLPRRQRQVVVADMNSPDGKVPSKELAQELGIGATTVREYRKRALERLKHALEAEEVAEEGEQDLSTYEALTKGDRHPSSPLSPRISRSKAGASPRFVRASK